MRGLAVGLALICALLSACSGGGKPVSTATATMAVAPSSSPKVSAAIPSPSPTVDPNKAADEAKVKADIQKYMFDNFGGSGNEKYATSWFRSIVDYDVIKSGDKFTIVVKTSLFPKDSNKDNAKKIITAVLGSEIAISNKLWGVDVNSSDGLPLESRSK